MGLPNLEGGYTPLLLASLPRLALKEILDNVGSERAPKLGKMQETTDKEGQIYNSSVSSC